MDKRLTYCRVCRHFKWINERCKLCAYKSNTEKYKLNCQYCGEEVERWSKLKKSTCYDCKMRRKKESDDRRNLISYSDS